MVIDSEMGMDFRPFFLVSRWKTHTMCSVTSSKWSKGSSESSKPSLPLTWCKGAGRQMHVQSPGNGTRI